MTVRTNSRRRWLTRAVTPSLVAAVLVSGTAMGQSSPNAPALVIDAAAQPAPPDTGFLRLGSNTSPDGHTIGATSRYLTRDGKPWLPVMGEFHFARYPEQYWEEEILKMQAGGVQIVSTYFFWIHHEEIEGQFDWSGQRDARRFVQLCAKHGMLVWARIGPWAHGEARNGGLPDWLLQKVGDRARSNDSTYLAYVARFYQQVGEQMRGLLWKDGGPIIGVQLDNEYTARGAGKGPEHILRLKALARAAGFDAPLYSVTGWDGASFPPAEVIPVFGGYPDAPWVASLAKLPPNEVYAFRFANRAAGNMGTQGAAGEASETSVGSLAPYPFLGAEYAGGIQDTYHRRPVIAADDIAAMVPVQLGSGVNLYGYYMFHGGANPPGKLTTLQESQLTGYPTDVPVVSYDFQAPLSEYGEMRESFRRVKPVHYFLQEFGAQLAPMVVRAPESVPNGPADTTSPRLAARTLGDSGFLFFSTYLRNYRLTAQRRMQVAVRFPAETLLVPAQPLNVPAGAYGIWPLNLSMAGARLKYSTAQLLTRVEADSESVYVFFAIPGIASEFSFDAKTVRRLAAPGARVRRANGRVTVSRMQTGMGAAISLRATDGSRVRIVLLTREQAGNAYRATIGGVDRLLVTPQDLFVDGDDIHLRSRGSPKFVLAALPALAPLPSGGVALRAVGREGIFTRYTATLRTRVAPVAVSLVREAQAAPPVKRVNTVTWRTDSVALAPNDSAFSQAGVWRITVPATALDGASDVFLDIDYEGDVARLYAGGVLLDDDFYRGTPWRIGLKRFADAIRAGPLELRILALRDDAPIYMEQVAKRSPSTNGQRIALHGVGSVTEYEVVIGPGSGRH